MFRQLGVNDCILFSSLLYSSADLVLEWDTFRKCSQPIHWWLLVSYTSIIAFRAVHVLGSQTSTSDTENPDAASTTGSDAGMGDFLLDFRHKGTLPRTLVAITWAVALPFFILWTAVGTHWLRNVIVETPQCMPSSMHLWFSGLWLVLCYVWIAVHIALFGVARTLEKRLQRAENDLRSIVDDDVRRRWGQSGQLSSYHEVIGSSEPAVGCGLSASQIKLLLGEETLTLKPGPGDGHPSECPICIMEFEAGDRVRRLPNCEHTFHGGCIDLWLLRRADCPLCKRGVAVGCSPV